MFDLVKICHHKQFLCIHDDVNDLIESALDSKLLSINSINSQCLDKKEQEVKNVEEQPAERRNLIEKSLQNFRCHGCGQPCDGYYYESCMCPQCGMTLFNGIYDNCIYGTGMPIICTECGGIVRGGLCLPCDLRDKDLYDYDPNAYSFDNSNYFSQLQDENYLCNLCGNNSHDSYNCQQQFLFVYEQEPSYNQNCDDNYYPHESLSFSCCDYCGGSHETFQCQPDNQNVDFSDSDQIQTPQYPDVNPQYPEIKYDQSTSTDRPIFLNDNEDHSVQNRESPENSSKENVISKTNQEPPQDSNMHQLIDECCEEVLEEQNALDSKLLSINSINSQCLDKKEQEFKNVVEQPAERRNRAEKSLQNFRVIHKSSISFKNTSQISSIHAVAHIQSTKKPEHLLNMGYEHPIIIPEMESDEVTESNAENLLPIPSKCEVTLEDEIECDMPAKDVCSPVFTTFSNPLFKDDDDLDSSDDESLIDEDVPAEEFKIYSNPLFDEDKINSDKLDPHCFNVGSDFVESMLNQIPKSDFDSEEEIRLIENLLYDNSFPRPPEELNAEIADTIIEFVPLLPITVPDGNSQQEEIDIVTSSDDVLPLSDENDDDYDPLLEEVDLFLSDDSIPQGIENIADDPERDIRFLEELLIDDSFLSHESFDPNFKDNPSISRPPSEPPDVESFFDLKPDDYPPKVEEFLCRILSWFPRPSTQRGQTSGRGAVIDTSRPLSRVVPGVTVRITTIAATTTTLATTS
nr:hypothetical protein [Tanacetum cinerariifolium]